MENENVSKSEILNIVMSGTFTLDPIKESINFWFEKQNIKSNIKILEYNQVFQHLIKGDSLLNQNDGLNLIFFRFEDWLRNDDESGSRIDLSLYEKNKFDKIINDFIEVFSIFSEISRAPAIVVFCPYSPVILSNITVNNHFKELENKLFDFLNKMSNVFPVLHDEIFDLYPVDSYYDVHSDKLGKIPYTAKYYDALGTMTARKYFTINNQKHKVIVLDCDNTLWKGICGEEEVHIDKSRIFLQSTMLRQISNGKILCICSKNNENDVYNVFSKNKDFLLKIDNFTVKKINWSNKSENIKSMAKELNLGLESFIFIDDSPSECLEVQMNIPQVLTICLPEKDDEIIGFLKNIWIFDDIRTTDIDKQRSELYSLNIKRNELEKSSISFSDFLSKLDIKTSFNKVNQSIMTRAAQLTRRVNQFNFTSVRRNEKELQTLLSNNNYDAFMLSAEDRFGDYGDVGLVIYKIENTSLIIDSFLLSCRAMGKGIEYEMLSKIIEISNVKNLENIHFIFIKTEKNEPALQFIQRIGKEFMNMKENEYSFNIPVSYIKGLSFKDLMNKSDVIIKSDVNVNDHERKATVQSNLNLFILDVFNNLKNIDIIHNRISENKKIIHDNQNEFVPPKTPTQKIVASIWKDVFNVDKIGIKEDFFSIGGDSIKAIQILSQINEKFQIEFPLSSLFENTFNIEELSNSIEILQLESVDDDVLQKELAELENLSEDDIKKLLESELEKID